MLNKDNGVRSVDNLLLVWRADPPRPIVDDSAEVLAETAVLHAAVLRDHHLELTASLRVGADHYSGL